MEAEAAAAAEEMTAKIEALTLADAEDAGEDAAQEDLIATLKANNEQLAAMVNDLREKLAETEQQLERKKGKIAKVSAETDGRSQRTSRATPLLHAHRLECEFTTLSHAISHKHNTHPPS